MSNKNLYVTRSSSIVEKIHDIEPDITVNKMLRDGIDYDSAIYITDEIESGFTAPSNGAIAVSGMQKEYKTLVPETLFTLDIFINDEYITQVYVYTNCMDKKDGVSHFVTFLEKGMTIKLKQVHIELPENMKRVFEFAPFKDDYNLRNNQG